MKVAVRFYGYVQQAFGKEDTDCRLPANSTVSDLVELLRSEEPRLAELFHSNKGYFTSVAIVVKGRVCPKSEWETTFLLDGAVVQFLPPAVGGSGLKNSRQKPVFT